MPIEKHTDVFCRIAKGEMKAAVLWQDREFIAMLDGFLNTRGQALVITKKHYDSYAFDMPQGVYLRLMKASKKTARMLERGLGVHRVAMVMEGLGVNHIHIKLYPLHGLRHKYHMKGSRKRKVYKQYLGYLATNMGPQADFTELKRLSERIKGAENGEGK